MSDLYARLVEDLGYAFVQNALIAGTLAAVLGAVVGYFVLIRRVSFAAHALGHIAFPGATGAALLGISPLLGMLGTTVAAAILIGISGNRLHRSDLAIGMVLSASLGLGTLFLFSLTGYSGQAKAILFGNILGVSEDQITHMVILSVLSLGSLALFSRKLLFASLQPSVAEARGQSLTGLSVGFLVVLAVSVTLASQVVGILLVFTLVIAPAGMALRMCKSFWSAMITSVVTGVVVVWVGILLSCLVDTPPSFWITTLFLALYLVQEAYLKLTQ